jgi:beta-galactosidase
MNNSNGNLHLYWEKFWDASLPRLQGGYIWDFKDQGLRKKTKDGREFFAYGGDFGDTINDKQFCINGMFSPDLDPHPSVGEIQVSTTTSGNNVRIRTFRPDMQLLAPLAVFLKTTR